MLILQSTGGIDVARKKFELLRWVVVVVVVDVVVVVGGGGGGGAR